MSVGAITALALIGAVVGLAALADAPPPQTELRPQLTDPGSPLAGGVRVSMVEAASRFAVPAFRPDTSLASDSTVQDVWMRSNESPQVYIRYRSGITVTIRPSSYALGTVAYAEAQLKDGVPGTLVEIGGTEAFEVPQSIEGDLGSIRFAIDDAIVTVVGHGDFTALDLRGVAESIVANRIATLAEHSTAA